MNLELLRLAIVDDEPKACKLLENLIKTYYPKAQIIGIADSVDKAHQLIVKEQPNVLLLDVNMPPSNGFELLKRLPSLNLEVIFVTNFADYAVKAFDFSAIAYILKPVTKEKLIDALHRVEQRLKEKHGFNRLQALIENMDHIKDPSNKIVIPTMQGREMEVSINDILRCESDGDITRIFIKTENEISSFAMNKGIGECEKLLDDHGFFRVHRQHLINLTYATSEIIKLESHFQVKLTNGEQVPLARRRKNDFCEALQSWNRFLLAL